MRVRVTDLHRYPVKSLAGERLESAELSARGLVGDRRWALVDGQGTKVTTVHVNAMLGLTSVHGQGAVTIRDRAGDEITVEQPVDGDLVPVSFSGQPSARYAGDEPSEWLSQRLGRELRLVWQDDLVRRPIPAELGGMPGDENSFAYAAAILLTSEESLAQLDEWRLDESPGPLAMQRFRPNVVVRGAAPFAEDSWASVRIAGVPFRRTMLCDRCVVTTIDPDSLERGPEPLRTLGRHRHWDGETWFGVRLTPMLAGGERSPEGQRVSVGDEVEVLDTTRSAQ